MPSHVGLGSAFAQVRRDHRLEGRQPLTPTRLLRLSKDLPHDWSEQRQFLGFAGETRRNSRPERSTIPDPKTASRDTTAVRLHPGV